MAKKRNLLLVCTMLISGYYQKADTLTSGNSQYQALSTADNLNNGHSH